MELKRIIVTGIVRRLLKALCAIESGTDIDLPRHGPGIVMFNHINFLDAPLIYVLFLPHSIAGLVKRETWDNPIFRFIAEAWDAIPITRRGVDTEAFRAIENALEQGRLVAIAPEGTRSGNGELGKGNPGITTLAWIHSVPVYPLVHFGGENVWKNIKRFRRTKVTIKMGKTFTMRDNGHAMTRNLRRELTDELMSRLADLLPDKYRGYYKNYDQAPSGHLVSNDS